MQNTKELMVTLEAFDCCLRYKEQIQTLFSLGVVGK